MTKIAIIYYSTYGHIAAMAEAVKKGVEEGGATCDIFQVEETLSEEILGKMGAPPKKDYPIITAAQLTEYDGFLFGISGRYGAMPAQMKVSIAKAVLVRRSIILYACIYLSSEI
jgi:NAD(P)H dehydrogenase (quinone)